MKRFIKTLENGFEPHAGGYQKRLLKLLFFWNPLATLIFTVAISPTGQWISSFATSYFISCVVLAVCFVGDGAVVFMENRWRKLRNIPPSSRSVLWHFTAASAFLLPGLCLAFSLVRFVAPWLGTPAEIGSIGNFDDYKAGIIFGAVICGFFVLLRARFDAKQATKDAQIAALTAQMNPHLLFNSLNTVASLIATDPAKAEDTVVRLAELYRGVLDSSQRLMHSLAQELEICEAYLAIEKARFGERIRTRVEIEKSVDPWAVRVPALCLQPLVENAVKHGISPRASGGEIRIFAEDRGDLIRFGVEDDGVGFGAALSSSGSRSALKNCEKRIHHHFGEKGIFLIESREAGGSRVLLGVPK